MATRTVLTTSTVSRMRVTNSGVSWRLPSRNWLRRFSAEWEPRIPATESQNWNPYNGVNCTKNACQQLRILGALLQLHHLLVQAGQILYAFNQELTNNVLIVHPLPPARLILVFEVLVVATGKKSLSRFVYLDASLAKCATE